MGVGITLTGCIGYAGASCDSKPLNLPRILTTRPNRLIADLRFTLTDPPKRSEIGRFGLIVRVGGHWHYFHRQHRVCRCLPLPSKKATTRRLYGVLSDNRDRLLVLTALKFARMHATPRASPGHRGYSRICNPPKRAGCQGESAIGDCLIWSDRKGWWIQTEPISTRLPDLN